MRKVVLLAIALLLWTAVPAAASPQLWLVDPGGAFSLSGRPVAVFPESPGARFSDYVYDNSSGRLDIGERASMSVTLFASPIQRFVPAAQ